MCDDVIVLGAGFSANAGIPLLRDFVDCMLDLANRGSINGGAILESKRSIIAKAVDVRNRLDSFHGRANFDDRNIEDILSILSFHSMARSTGAHRQFENLKRAIAETIELTCNVKHPGIPSNGSYEIIENGHSMYREFWAALFKWKLIGHQFPAIVSFNYDLVLERSLLQYLVAKEPDFNATKLGKNNIVVRYHYPLLRDQLWRLVEPLWRGGDSHLGQYQGRAVEISPSVASDSEFPIDYLKLHGSLNFPVKKDKENIEGAAVRNLLQPVETPYILPPIFNKLDQGTPSQMWRVALEKISGARNLIFVGYSLPNTDIYMQYFLKAALGPNLNVNRIHVFDPVLSDAASGAGLRSRFESCFSPQLRPRMEFHALNGAQFTRMLYSQPESILY